MDCTRRFSIVFGQLLWSSPKLPNEKERNLHFATLAGGRGAGGGGGGGGRWGCFKLSVSQEVWVRVPRRLWCRSGITVAAVAWTSLSLHVRPAGLKDWRTSLLPFLARNYSAVWPGRWDCWFCWLLHGYGLHGKLSLPGELQKCIIVYVSPRPVTSKPIAVPFPSAAYIVL